MFFTGLFITPLLFNLMPQVLVIPTFIPSSGQSNLLSFYTMDIIISYMTRKFYSLKIRAFKRFFHFRIRQHRHEQFNLRYKICNLYKMLGVFSFCAALFVTILQISYNNPFPCFSHFLPATFISHLYFFFQPPIPFSLKIISFTFTIVPIQTVSRVQ